MRFHHVDIRDAGRTEQAIRSEQPALVLHLAAQVAVTTSVTAPRHDFEVNALGTFNVLEAARSLSSPPVVIYASTNKVYGKLGAASVIPKNRRYEFADFPNGIDESAGLDFYSPYGCSKGAADQYVLDYARIFGLRTVAMRQSCIYGTRQFGVEDQGWIAWFVIAAVTGHPITIYGDGLQVRDVLWVDDLISLYLKAYEHIDRVCGQALNVGGGPEFSLSLLESLDLIGEALDKQLDVSYGDWRPGDQPVFIADTSLAQRQLGWRPAVSPGDGIGRPQAIRSSDRPLHDGACHQAPIRRSAE